MKKFFKALAFIASLAILSGAFVSCSDDGGDDEPTKYTVTFESNGGSTVENQTVEKGKKVTKPTDPTKDGNIFSGWYKETALTNAWDFDTDTVTKNITLYAKWEEIADNESVVTFNSNGGTGEIAAQTVLDGSKASAPDTNPSKTGYTFKGWFTSTDNGTTLSETAFDFDTAITASITLYAKWEILTFKIKFYKGADEATGEMSDQTVNYSEETAISSNEFTYSGHKFAGWATEAGGSKVYDNGTAVKLTSADLELYALWTELPANVGLVNFNKNSDDATGTMSEEEFVVGTAKNLTASTFTRPYYTFAGWNTQADGSGTSYGDGDSFTIASTGTTTLYAQWTPITYTIKFGANEGSGTITDQVFTVETEGYGASLKITAIGSSITRTGYDFAGWKAGENSVADEAVINETLIGYADENNEIALTAQWQIKQFTVTLTGEGITQSSTTVDYNSSYSQPTAPTRTGYTFSKWQKDNSDVSFPLTITENVTLTATWTINKHKVTIETADNGTVTVKNGTETVTSDSTEIDYGTELTIELSATDGYTGSVAVTAGDDGITVTDNKFTMPDSDVTVTATFTAGNVAYTVTYKFQNIEDDNYSDTAPSGFSGGTASGNGDVDSTVTINTPTVEGFTLVDEQSGNLTKTISANADANDWVIKYDRNKYTVTYEAGTASGTSGIPSTQSDVKFGANVTPTLTGIASTDSDFNGWKDADDNEYPANGTTSFTMPAKDVTLTAQWQKKTFTVAFNVDGGTTVASIQNVEYGSTLTEEQAPAPAKDGYVFDGWYSDSGKNTAWSFGTNGTQVTGITTGSTVTIYAKWNDGIKMSFDKLAKDVFSDATGDESKSWSTWNENAEKVSVETKPTSTGYEVTVTYDSTTMTGNKSSNEEMASKYGTAIWAVTTTTFESTGGVKVNYGGTEYDLLGTNGFFFGYASENATGDAQKSFHDWWILKAGDDVADGSGGKDYDRNGMTSTQVFKQENKADTEVVWKFVDTDSTSQNAGD